MAGLTALLPLLGSIGGKGGGQSGGGGGMAGKAGGAVALATSAVQGLQAAKLKKEANAAMPEFQDPRQTAMLSELNQKRRSIETGADFAAAKQAADTGQAAANEAIVQVSGGDAGSAMQGILQAQRNSGDVRNAGIAQGQTQQGFYDNAAIGLQNLISAREMQLRLLNSQQKRAEWSTKAQAAGANFQAGMAKVLGSKQAGQPAGATPTITPPTPASIPAANADATGPVTPPLSSLAMMKNAGTPITLIP